MFDPNVPTAVPPEKLGAFINDAIARMLAGIAAAGRPLFLKIVYHGPKALEELVAYDPHLVVGILGGSAGTTRDAFQLLYDAKKYGGRVALFGRKINNAECQLAFVEFLRLIADGQLEPVEAVKAYHGVLQKLGIPPKRQLDEDLSSSTGAMSYGGSTTTISVPGTTQAKVSPTVQQRPPPLRRGGRGEARLRADDTGRTPRLPPSAPQSHVRRVTLSFPRSERGNEIVRKRSRAGKYAFRRLFAAVDAVGEADAVISVARQGQPRKRASSLFDGRDQVEVPDVILRHRPHPARDDREIGLPGDSQDFLQFALHQLLDLVVRKLHQLGLHGPSDERAQLHAAFRGSTRELPAGE